MLYRALFSSGQKSNLVDRLKLPQRVVYFTLEVLKQILSWLEHLIGWLRLHSTYMKISVDGGKVGDRRGGWKWKQVSRGYGGVANVERKGIRWFAVEGWVMGSLGVGSEAAGRARLGFTWVRFNMFMFISNENII